MVKTEEISMIWFKAVTTESVPENSGIALRYGDAQLALFHFARRGEWYATQNLCPHKRQMVLGRAMLGDASEIPKIACPMHKKTYSLRDGCGLNDPEYSIQVYETKVEDGHVFIRLPEDPAEIPA